MRRMSLYLVACGCTLPGPAMSPESSTTSSAQQSQWTVRGHIPIEKFVIHSHRGAGTLAPENTIAAFEMGWKLGTVPEADMRTTKDGVIVAFHDANFKRTVDTKDPELKKKGVSDLTFAELSQLDVGAWKGPQYAGLHAPKLTEVFQLMRGRRQRQLCLDFKYVDLEQLAGEVRSCGVSGQVVFATTDYTVLRKWKALLPDSETLLWLGGADEELKPRLAQLRAAGFEGITHLQFHPRANTTGKSDEPFTISRALVRSTGEEMRSHGILFMALPWEITDEKAYWQLLDLGVASFSTDHPELALKAVRNYYARP